jgi:hypothetical protein
MKNIFISHSWRYDDYQTVYNWLKEELSFYDYSIPEHDNCGENLSEYELKKCIENQIKYSSIVVIIGRIAVSYSKWIEFEIDTAYKMGKCIILIKPWGNERLPENAKNKATEIIGWNKKSLVEAVKNCGEG